MQYALFFAKLMILDELDRTRESPFVHL